MIKQDCLSFLTLLFTYWGTSTTSAGNTDVCMTPDCVRMASLLLNAIDETADPCEDFWQFTCGKWIKAHVIDDDQTAIGVVSGVRRNIDIILKNLLEEETSDDKAVVRHAKRLYQSCANTDLIEKERLAPAFKMIESLGGWPVIGNMFKGKFNETNFNLEQLLIASHKIQPGIIIKVSTCYDSYEPTHYKLCVLTGSLGLRNWNSFSHDDDDKNLEAYERFAYEMANFFGGYYKTKERKLQIKEMIEFEKQLANISLNDGYGSEKNVNISYMNANYPKFNWTTYFSGILRRPDLDIAVNDSTTVSVQIPHDTLQQGLNLLSKTPKRVIQNYVVWRILMELTDALPNKIRELYTDFQKVINGKRKQSDRWVTCIREVEDTFRMVVDRLFIKDTHKESEQKLVDDMTERIREAVTEIIEEKRWLDECSKAKSKDKAISMKKIIGFLPELNNDTHVKLEYKDYVFHEPSYFQNVLKKKTLESRFELEKLKKRVDPEQRHRPTTEVNAFYRPWENTIVIPAGFLQPPLLDTRYPKYLNYGGIGTIIGHEIIHGFDNKGRRYNKDGDNRQWWSDESIAAFEDRTKCMEDQYSKFTVKGTDLTINGKRTLPDNISDNGGLKASWLAYKKWVEESNGGRPEPSLPGLNYSTPQLFFLNYAYHCCDKMRPEAARERYKYGSHSDFPTRINGPLQNSKDFADAFQCKEGTYMNPKNKCDIW